MIRLVLFLVLLAFPALAQPSPECSANPTMQVCGNPHDFYQALDAKTCKPGEHLVFVGPPPKCAPLAAPRGKP